MIRHNTRRFRSRPGPSFYTKAEPCAENITYPTPPPPLQYSPTKKLLHYQRDKRITASSNVSIIVSEGIRLPPALVAPALCEEAQHVVEIAVVLELGLVFSMVLKRHAHVLRVAANINDLWLGNNEIMRSRHDSGWISLRSMSINTRY